LWHTKRHNRVEDLQELWRRRATHQQDLKLKNRGHKYSTTATKARIRRSWRESTNISLQELFEAARSYKKVD
jgi:hypothetical protein